MTNFENPPDPGVLFGDKLFRAMWSLATNAFALSDAEGIVLAANAAYYNLYGYTPEEILGKPFSIIFPSDQRAIADEQYRQVFQSEEVLPGFESVIQRRDGSTRIVESHYDFVVDNGRRVLMLSTIRDITERKRLEQSLRESEQRFREFLDASVDGFILYRPITDETGELVDVEFDYENRAASELNKTDRAQAQGKRVLELFPSARENVIWQKYREVWRTGIAAQFENQYEGESISGWFRHVVMRLGDRLADHFADITERKQAEVKYQELLAQLGQERNRWQATVENMLDPVTVADAQGHAIYMNAAYSRLVNRFIDPNLDLDQTPGYYQLYRPDGTLFKPDELPLQRAALSGEQVREMEVIQRSPDGQEHFFLWNASPLRDATGGLSGAVAIGHEITAQRRAEEEREALLRREQEARAQAEAAVRLRDQFFSIASHELRNPMTTLIGYTELLHKSAEGHDRDAREKRALESIATQTERLNQMINTLLDASRAEMGKLTIEQGPVDVRALAAKLVQEEAPTLRKHTLELTGPQEPQVVSGDPMRLDQVLRNLVHNAIKYSPEGGPVRVQVQRDGDSVRLSVSDNGIGVPPAALPLLFQRFYRAENAVSQHISGLGIGLYLIREIVQLHGGTVEVESEEGRGSTFKVSLPLLAPDAAGDKPSPDRAADDPV